MSSSEMGIIKDLKDAIKAPEKKKTQGYYTRATVKRIEGKTAWVHIPGGVDETPVSLTINAAPGDAVQVRVEGGRAWIVGNISAPPTDDKMANKALMYAQYLEKKMGKQVQEVQDDLDALIENDIVAEIQRYCLANQNHIPAGQTFDNIKYSAWSDDIPEYVTGKYFWHRVKYVHKNGDITFSDPWFDGGLQVSAEARIAAGVAATAAETAQGIADQALGKAEGTEKYFWHDSSGAHVSDTENRVDVGNSQTISSNGTIIMRNGKLVTSWTGSSSSDAALNFYDCTNASARTGDLMASYTRAGIILYANNNQALSVTPSGMAVYKSDGSSTLASFTGSGISFADDVPFTIGNSNSYVKWVRENNVWKVKICADEIQMGGKDVMAGGVAVNDNLVNVGIWDSSFVSNVIGWTKESSATLTYDASTGLVTITAPNSNNWGLYQDITVKANTKYTISAKVGAKYYIGFGTSTYPSDTETGWQTASNGRVYKTFTTGSSTTYRIYVYAKGSSNPCYINNIKIEEGDTYTGWAPGNSSRFMTYVSSSYGVRVYSGAGRPNTYAQVDANGMKVVSSGTTYASFGSTCTIGSTSSYNLQIEPTYFYFKNASTTIGNIHASSYGGIEVGANNSELMLHNNEARLMTNNNTKGIIVSSVSNDVTLMGGLSLVLDNNCSLYGKTTNSSLFRTVVLNSDNNLVIGWDNYNSATGTTAICGNKAELRGNSTVNLLLIDHDNSWDKRIEFHRDQNDDYFLRPTTHNTIKLGSENYKWAKISAVDSNIGSDLKDKDIIEDFDWKVDEFISGLKPIAYRLNFHDGEEHHRIRLGFGAQDVSKLAHDINLGDMSMYQATIKGYNDEGEIEDIEYHGEPDIDDSMLTWTLSYYDFIAPIVVELQRLMARVDVIERNSA